MSSTPAIRVRGLSHRFGSFAALDDVSFDVGHGEVFGFIGPNGAGKTTTIRSIATLHEPEEGTIEVCGIDVRHSPELVRGALGYMPDHAGVYERITGSEYLEFFADVQELPRSRVAEVVELTGLGPSLERYVADLSKGMRQRMQLARIMLHDPEVLILDEPASDLDPRARIELRELILELKRRGKTILLSSHILSELSDVCTHVGILDHGRMLAYGPIAEIARTLAAPDREHAAPHDAEPYRKNVDPHRRAAKLRVIGDAERIASVLIDVPKIEGVIVSNLGSVSLTYDNDERTLGAAVKALVQADLLVCSVEPDQNELERIFLHVTKGGAR